MTTITRQWIAELNSSLLKMSTMVEESLRTAMAAIQHQNGELAKRVREHDAKIDALDNRIRNDAIKTLALQQPVGGDLRFLISTLSMVGKLERVGDNALNIAGRLLRILEEDPADRPDRENDADLQQMGDLAIKMLSQAINSFVEQDTNLARQVINSDQRVDELFTLVENSFLDSIRAREAGPCGYHHAVIARNLERIADQATSVAESVIFLVEGQNVRHQDLSELPKLQFAISPFKGLERHAELVNQCVSLAGQCLEKYTGHEPKRFAELAIQVNQIEHEADAVKRNIRGHLPKGIIMPIDKFELFAFVKEQDKVADDAQTLVDWLSLMECTDCSDTAKTLHALYGKCHEASSMLVRLVHEAEAFFRHEDEKARNRVKQVIYDIRHLEHEADALEMSLKHLVFKQGKDPIRLHHVLTTVDLIGQIADHAENAADMMRAMVAR